MWPDICARLYSNRGCSFMKRHLKSATAFVAAASAIECNPRCSFALSHKARPLVTAQPDHPAPAVAPYYNAEPHRPLLTRSIIPLLQQQVKYVFVIFNENHSIRQRVWDVSRASTASFSGQCHAAISREHARLHPVLPGRERSRRHRAAVPARAPSRIRDLPRQRRPFPHRPRHEDPTWSTARRR